MDNKNELEMHTLVNLNCMLDLFDELFEKGHKFVILCQFFEHYS